MCGGVLDHLVLSAQVLILGGGAFSELAASLAVGGGVVLPSGVKLEDAAEGAVKDAVADAVEGAVADAAADEVEVAALPSVNLAAAGAASDAVLPSVKLAPSRVWRDLPFSVSGLECLYYSTLPLYYCATLLQYSTILLR